MAGPTDIEKREVEDSLEKCTKGAFRECDPVVLSCAGARGSDCLWQMDEHEERGTEVGGDDDAPPQLLKRRSQSTKSRRVFSPCMLVKETECWKQRFTLQACVCHHCTSKM